MPKKRPNRWIGSMLSISNLSRNGAVLLYWIVIHSNAK